MTNKIMNALRILWWNLYYYILRITSSSSNHTNNSRGAIRGGAGSGPGAGTGNRHLRKSIKILLISIGGVFCLVLLQGRFIWVHLASTTTRTNADNLPLDSNKSSNNERTATTVKGSSDKKLAKSMMNGVIDRKHEQRIRNEYIDLKNALNSDERSTCHRIMSFARQKANVRSSDSASFLMSKIWMESIVDILLASQHPDDPEYSHQDWTKQLLAELSPSQLERTIVAPKQTGQQQAQSTRTSIIEGLDRIIDILRLRLEAPDLHPPLRIAVIGGASTEGKNCQQVADSSKVHIPQNSMMNNPTYCAWPYRFESFVNTLAGIPLITVVNMGEEGTSTLTKTPLLKYWMYPKPLLPEGPDVIIHSYQNHDESPFTDEKKSFTETLAFETKILKDTIRLARPCGDSPLLIYMADPSQLNDKTFLNTILNSASKTSTAMKTEQNRGTSARYKKQQQSGIIAIDYTRAMEHVVSTDQDSESLSATVQFDDDGMVMAAHLAMMWILAYNVGNAILRHCDAATSATSTDGSTDASAAFASLTATSTRTCQESPCIFAWLAGPMGNVRTADEINFYINPFVVENYGWNSKTDMSTGWSRKAGLVAMTPKAKIILEYHDVPLTTRMINIMTVKSAISSYKHSRAVIKVTVLNHQTKNIRWENSIEVDGFFIPKQYEQNDNAQLQHHSTFSQTSSITFPSLIDLKTKSALKGETIRLEIELVHGITFKVLGMMFCSR